MNGSEIKLNRVSPTSSFSKIQGVNNKGAPPPYKGRGETPSLPPLKDAPVGSWAMETWQPPLPADKCPLPPIKRTLPVCDTYNERSTSSANLAVCDTFESQE